MNILNDFRIDNLKGDIYGGITVAIVALPLALAFGVASGIGPMAGIYGAICIGFFAAVFGGTPSQISGPTGPMTVVMASIVAKYHENLGIVFTIIILAGLFQVMFGVLKLGRYISLISFPVISGFMTGIGCIIIILQLAPLMGYVLPPDGVLDALKALPEQMKGINLHSFFAGLMAFVIILFMPNRINTVFPAPLFALIVGALVVGFVLKDAETLGAIPSGLPDIYMPTLSVDLVQDMITSALILALLGSIDSLLTSLVAENITQVQHDPNKELVGQGIGNMVAGAFGGLPGAGATMRTVTNIQTGGRSPISGITHSMILLALVLGLGGMASYIPYAVLAGMLIKVGIDIIDWGYLRRIHRAPRSDIFFMLTVLFLTVFVNLIVAVVVGVVLSSLLLTKRMADLQLDSIKEIEEHEDSLLEGIEKEILKQNRGRIVLISMEGPMSFGAARGMVKRLKRVRQYDVMVLDMSKVNMIDSTTSVALEDVISRVQGANKHILVVGLSSNIRETLESFDALKSLTPSHIHKSRQDALKHAADISHGMHKRAPILSKG